jgi:hypothetical protein
MNTSRDEISKKVLTARAFGTGAKSAQNPPVVRFTLSYDTARIWCEIVIRAEGGRVGAGAGHHEKTIKLAAEILGPEARGILLRLDRARKARNEVLYEGQIELVSPEDVEALGAIVDELQELVLSWLKTNHPDLLPLFP